MPQTDVVKSEATRGNRKLELRFWSCLGLMMISYSRKRAVDNLIAVRRDANIEDSHNCRWPLRISKASYSLLEDPDCAEEIYNRSDSRAFCICSQLEQTQPELYSTFLPPPVQVENWQFCVQCRRWNPNVWEAQGYLCSLRRIWWPSYGWSEFNAAWPSHWTEERYLLPQISRRPPKRSA